MRVGSSLIVGDRRERFLHPCPSSREIYVRPAIHPDPTPQPIGDELRERIASFVEAHAPYVWRRMHGIAARYLRAGFIALLLSYAVIGIAIVYFAAEFLR